jgi:predicted dehydrogenase
MTLAPERVSGGTPVCVLVVGYGDWGARHARVLETMPGVTLCLYDPDPVRRSLARAWHPTATTFAHPEEAFARADAVIVASPVTTHESVARRALRAGKHVLAAPPMAMRLGDAEELVREAAAGGLALVTGHAFQFDPVVSGLKTAVDSGALGRLLFADLGGLRSSRARPESDVIWDLAAHDLALLAHLVDGLPSALTVWSQHEAGPDGADATFLRLGFAPDRSDIVLRAGRTTRTATAQFTVVGDRRTVSGRAWAGGGRLQVYDTGTDPGALRARERTLVTAVPSGPDALAAQDRHFVDVVRTGLVESHGGHADFDLVRVLEGAARAHHSGTRVVVTHPDRLELRTFVGVA